MNGSNKKHGKVCDMAEGLKGGLTSYGDAGFSLFIRQAFARHLGFDNEDFDRPVIGICNTESEVNRCHTHFGPIVEAIKRGVLMAGGVPLEFPTISLGEVFMNPTTMLYRNLAAMDTEEMIRAQPIDAVVLVTGCDKTTPAALMGAASANKPAILVTGGPMANGEYEGETLGACTDCRFYWQEYRAGRISEEALDEINQRLAPTAGHCMVMGSASTIAVASEAMGMALPGSATHPAPETRRLKVAEASGKRIVGMVSENLRPVDIMTRPAFENAIRAISAVGGSTNAVIHLTAIARRVGVVLTLDDFDRISRDTPFIGNVRPAGKYQMEDFDHAGGVPALLKELEPLLKRDVMTCTGSTVGELLDRTPKCSDVYRNVIYPLESPLHPDGGLVVLRGNLAPNGALIKPKAASARLLRHSGRAVVFDSLEDLGNRIDDPDLDVTSDDVLVLRNAGPIGAPGMPEAGTIPIPKKLLAEGVTDMVRISDCRMSGTAFGTVVLHVAPEAAAGVPLSLVETGDMISLDVDQGELELLVDEGELERRRLRWKAPVNDSKGFVWLYREHVMQANEGCDFDFLTSGFDPSSHGGLRPPCETAD